MAKYQNTQVEQLENELNAPTQQPEPQGAPTSMDDESFKKRYGDLRRHLATVQGQKDQEIESLRDQLDQAAKGQII